MRPAADGRTSDAAERLVAATPALPGLVAARERLEAPVPEEPAGSVFIVPYCHPDWAWTHTRRWHAERYALAMAEALDLLRAQEEAGLPGGDSAAFRWYLDVFVTELQPFLERMPERLPELRRWVAAGRIAVCGGYANVRVNHVEGETFVRSLAYGRRAFRALFPEADLSVHADLVDVAWGHPQLPQLLRQAGYRFLRGWRPHDALNAKGVPYHFRWRGLDGSVVLCSRGSYGGAVHPDLVPPDFRERWDDVRRRWEEHPQTALGEQRERSPVPLWWVQHGADDNRPLRTIFWWDTPLDVPAFIAEWNRREPPRMRFATPVEVFAALEERQDLLPIVSGALDPCDVCYNAAWAGSHGLWLRRRNAARTLLAAELLASLAHGLGAPYPQETLEALWRDTLLCSCHATQWLFQDDFDELAALATATTWRAEQQVRSAAGALVERIDLPPRVVAVVVNPLPFARTALVPLRLTFVEGDRGGVPDPVRLLDGEGRDAPYQVNNALRHAGVTWELEVLARVTLPAGGWNVVRWAAEVPPERPVAAPTDDGGGVTLENEWLRLDFRGGRLFRVTDTETGWVDAAPAALPFGHLRAYQVDASAPLHVGAILGWQDVEWSRVALGERGPLRQSLHLEGRVGAHPVEADIRLPAGERRVELAVRVEWQGMDGFLALLTPLPFPGELWGGIPYGVERKALDREPYVGIERQRAGMFWAQHFVDWTDGRRGLAYVPHDGDTYYIWDRAEGSLAHILINSVRRPTDTWEKDINAAMEGRGEHQFTASLIWHAGDWRAAQLWRTSADLAPPPLIAYPRRGRGPLPASGSLLAVEPANVALAAYYREGDAQLLRLYETAGEPTTATVTLPAAFRSAEPVTLLNEPLPSGTAAATPRLAGRQLKCVLGPWQIVTLALRA